MDNFTIYISLMSSGKNNFFFKFLSFVFVEQKDYHKNIWFSKLVMNGALLSATLP